MKLLRILMHQEGETWVAVCLDVFIAAQGATREEALRRWKTVFLAQVEVDFKEGRKTLEWIKPAPASYWDEAADPNANIELFWADR